MDEQRPIRSDGLAAQPTEMPRLGGAGPFVINLASSGVPMKLPEDLLASFPGTRLYRLKRTEDRRVRYRLRLGPFSGEDAADAALHKLRESYPSALTATATEDDLRLVAHLLPVPRNAPAVNIESTQTMRPLTDVELADDEASPCYVIQLSVAEQAFNPDDLPSLDIFGFYRLYSVADCSEGRVAHVLRLGFFGSEIAAGAVQSYIAAHYPSAKIERVSRAERERFDEQLRVEARKDVGASGVHAVIEITDELLVRPRFATTGDAGAEPTAAPAR